MRESSGGSIGGRYERPYQMPSGDLRDALCVAKRKHRPPAARTSSRSARSRLLHFCACSAHGGFPLVCGDIDAIRCERPSLAAMPRQAVTNGTVASDRAVVQSRRFVLTPCPARSSRVPVALCRASARPHHGAIADQRNHGRVRMGIFGGDRVRRGPRHRCTSGPWFQDVERWGALTISTGLGDAHFTNRKVKERQSRKTEGQKK